MNRIACGVVLVTAMAAISCQDMHRAIMGVHSRSVRMSGEAPPMWLEKIRAMDSIFEAAAVERACGAQPIRVLCVSADWFQAAETQPMLGRAFLAQEEPVANVAILSRDYWQRTFGGDPAIVGRTIDIGARKCTIVGVVRESKSRPVEAYLPQKDMRGDAIVARLMPGVTAKQAQAALETAGIKAKIE